MKGHSTPNYYKTQMLCLSIDICVISFQNESCSEESEDVFPPEPDHKLTSENGNEVSMCVCVCGVCVLCGCCVGVV